MSKSALTGALIAAGCLAVVFCAPAGRSQEGREAAPARQKENRFLFIVDTSSSMRADKVSVRQGVTDLLKSAMQGQMRDGDTIGLWNYDDELHTEFPMQIWSADDSPLICERVAAYLTERRYRKKARLEKVLPYVHKLIQASRVITIVFVYDGSQPMRGTPFDKDINDLQKKFLSEVRAADVPFMTILAARDGEVFDYSVNLPNSVKVPVTAEPVKPPVAVTNAPPPVAVAAPTNIVLAPPPRPFELVMSGRHAHPTNTPPGNESTTPPTASTPSAPVSSSPAPSIVAQPSVAPASPAPVPAPPTAVAAPIAHSPANPTADSLTVPTPAPAQSQAVAPAPAQSQTVAPAPAQSQTGAPAPAQSQTVAPAPTPAFEVGTPRRGVQAQSQAVAPAPTPAPAAQVVPTSTTSVPAAPLIAAATLVAAASSPAPQIQPGPVPPNASAPAKTTAAIALVSQAGGGTSVPQGSALNAQSQTPGLGPQPAEAARPEPPAAASPPPAADEHSTAKVEPAAPPDGATLAHGPDARAQVAPMAVATSTGDHVALLIIALSLLTIAVVLVLFLVRRSRGGPQPSFISQSIDRPR